MKITCSTCDARYSVRDDRIAGRSVKIRCKRCGAEILARGPAAAAAAMPELFLLVEGEQRGPLGEGELRALVAAGAADGATLVWHAELADWTPLAEVPELLAMLERAAPPSSPFDVGDAGESPFAAAASDGDVVASSAGEPPRRDAASATAATGARNESSLLFSLANLQDLATSGGAGAARAPAVRSAPAGHASAEGSGLIDIRALTAAVTRSEPRTSLPTFDLVLSVGSPTAALGSPLAAPVIAPAPRRRPSHAVTALAGLAAVTALALGGIAFAAIGRATAPVAREASGPIAEGPLPLAPPNAEPNGEPRTGAASEPGVVALVDEPRELDVAPEPAPEPATEPAPVRARERPGTAPVARSEPARPPTPPAAPGELRPASSGSSTLEDLMHRVSGADGPDVATASERPSASLPETPARESVREAMEALTPTVRGCAAGAHGRALVSVVVTGATGRARSATVGGDFTGTDAGSCIARAARGVELAPFARTTFTIAYPFAL